MTFVFEAPLPRTGLAVESYLDIESIFESPPARRVGSRSPKRPWSLVVGRNPFGEIVHHAAESMLEFKRLVLAAVDPEIRRYKPQPFTFVFENPVQRYTPDVLAQAEDGRFWFDDTKGEGLLKLPDVFEAMKRCREKLEAIGIELRVLDEGFINREPRLTNSSVIQSCITVAVPEAQRQLLHHVLHGGITMPLGELAEKVVSGSTYHRLFPAIARRIVVVDLDQPLDADTPARLRAPLAHPDHS